MSVSLATAASSNARVSRIPNHLAAIFRGECRCRQRLRCSAPPSRQSPRPTPSSIDFRADRRRFHVLVSRCGAGFTAVIAIRASSTRPSIQLHRHCNARQSGNRCSAHAQLLIAAAPSCGRRRQKDASTNSFGARCSRTYRHHSHRTRKRNASRPDCPMQSQLRHQDTAAPAACRLRTPPSRSCSARRNVAKVAILLQAEPATLAPQQATGYTRGNACRDRCCRRSSPCCATPAKLPSSRLMSTG